MYNIHKNNKRDIKTVGSTRFGIQALLKGIYIHNDLLFFHISVKNQSRISYDIDYLNNLSIPFKNFSTSNNSISSAVFT